MYIIMAVCIGINRVNDSPVTTQGAKPENNLIKTSKEVKIASIEYLKSII